MRLRLLITFVVVGLAVACSARPAEEDYAYEDDAPAEVAPAPSTKAPARHGLASRTARGPSPLIGSRGVKTTAAPVKPAEPEVVNEPEEVEEEEAGENEEVVPVTTEAPKKGLMRNVVRPFRSNQDLLAALKRKRQQEHYRVVYEYLFVRFGYPVNLHHKLDLSPYADTGSDSDARSEINEVTSGDSEPPPKFKPGQAQVLVAERLIPTQVEQAKVELETAESVITTKIEPERVESALAAKIEPDKVDPERVESIAKIEPAKVVPINGTLSTSASFSVSFS